MVMPDMSLAAPEIFMFSMACVVLLVDLFLDDDNRFISFTLTQATLVVGAILVVMGAGKPAALTFSNMYIHDTMASTLKLVMLAVVFFVFSYSRAYLKARNMYRGEYFVLGLFGVVGMMVIASASHFLTLYMGLELMSLCMYAMVALRRDSIAATEAAMKYFILGALASGMLLYGMSLLYGVSGSLEIAAVHQAVSQIGISNMPLVLGLVFVVTGLAFKLGAVPFHMWVPDVYHGAPTAVTLYIGSAPKLAAFAMVMRLLVGGLESLSSSWQDMLVILAILSMGAGNLMAIAQSNIKRMLAYSAISHMGFMLLGILSVSNGGYSAAMFYVLAYAVMSLGGFGMIMLLSRAGFEAETLEDFKGLNKRSPWYAFLMLLLMFSMAGVPPALGFWAKMLVVQSVIEAGMLWLAIVAVLFAVIGAYYYLRIVKLMYFDEPDTEEAIEGNADMRVMLTINALGLILVLPWIGSIISICRQAIAQLS